MLASPATCRRFADSGIASRPTRRSMGRRDPVAGHRGTLRRQLVLAFSLFALAILVATLVPFGVVSAHAHLATYIDQERAEANRAAESLVGRATITQQVVDRYAGSDSA